MGTSAWSRGAWKPRSRSSQDEGHFFVLAGVLLILAFLSTGVAVVEVRSLEAHAHLDTSSSTLAISQWRLTRLVLVDDVLRMIPHTLQPQDVGENVLASLRAAFTSWLREFGHVGTVSIAAGLETPLLDANGDYDATSVDQARHYTHEYDGVNDGILWQVPCPETTDAAGCIVGIILRLEVMDYDYTLSEPVLYATG